MKHYPLLLVLLLFAPLAALADNAGLALPPDGHVIVHLSAQENATLPQDLLVASLRFEKEDKNAKAAQNAVNTAMARGLDLAKKHTAVKPSTGSYNVYRNDRPVIDPKTGQHTGRTDAVWVASQTLDIESRDAVVLLDLVGALQDAGFVMNSLTYTLSPEKSEAARDTLITAALQKLRAKAALVAKSLDKSGYDLVDVTIDSGAVSPPMPFARGMAMMTAKAESDMANPIVNAGETTVTLGVSARVLLKP